MKFFVTENMKPEMRNISIDTFDSLHSKHYLELRLVIHNMNHLHHFSAKGKKQKLTITVLNSENLLVTVA